MTLSKETEELDRAGLYMVDLEQSIMDRKAFESSPLGQAMEAQRMDQNDRLLRIETQLGEANRHLGTASKYQKDIRTMLMILMGLATGAFIRVFEFW